MDPWLRILQHELSQPLPGIKAQLLMAPPFRKPVLNHEIAKNAGVLILLFKKQDEFYTVFIKRVEYKGVHSGQISFPGGMFEPDDASLEQTAIREAEEETGISADFLSVLGTLTPLYIHASHVNVLPVVATYPDHPRFKPDPGEVEYVIEVPVKDLMNSENIKHKSILINGQLTEVPYYNANGNHIWGATAMMLSEFLAVLKRAET